MYLDQILSGGNKQDGLATASMIEAALRHLSATFRDIASVTVQSDNAKCYQSHELVLIIGMMNPSLPIKITGIIHTETQDGKGYVRLAVARLLRILLTKSSPCCSLIDAHFARGMGHVSRYMLYSLANKLRKIATAEGLAFALAWGDGIQNSAVQLVSLDFQRLEQLRALLTPVVVKLKKFFTRANEISFMDINESWPFKNKSVVLEDNSKMGELGFSFKSWAYSGIGKGLSVAVNIATKEVTVTAQPEQEEEEEEMEEEDAAHDDNDGDEDEDEDEMTLAELARARDRRRGKARAPAEQQARGTARKRKRGDHDSSGSGSEESASSDGASCEEGSDGESAAESDADAEEMAMVFGPYGPGDDADPACAAKRLTGVCVMKRSTYGYVRGPRSKAQLGGVVAPAAGATAGAAGAARRKDAVAEGVRIVKERLENDNFVRPGKMEMPEYVEAATTPVPPLNGGWARRPGWGKQYGATYIKQYKGEIEKLFNQGAANSSVKMNPTMMLDVLRRKYPGRFSLPGENEIRTLIGTLFSRGKKQRAAAPQEEDGGGGDGEQDGELDGDGAPGPRKRGRKSKLPAEYLTYLGQLLAEDGAMMPKVALRKLKEQFNPLTVEDKQVTTKFSAMKQAARKTEMEIDD